LLETRLKEIGEVVNTESLLPLLEYLNETLTDQGKPAKDICSNPALFTQALGLLSLRGERGSLRSHYMDQTCSRVRISVRLRSSTSRPTTEIVDQIHNIAVETMKDTGQVTVTGFPVLFAGLSAKFAWAQVLSLGLALLVITVLMMIQFRSVTLGLLSLIPNILPLSVIFGVMGWLGLNLDGVTVFAAAVSLGLSVDGTIHYVTQFETLERARQAGRGRNVRQSLLDAYSTTARAVISTSIVLSLGFLMLVMSPFLSIVHFGFLCALAILAALVGDLILMPAAILSFSPIMNLVSKELKP
jgi:predicted RND superfamily exporter protein